MHDWRGICQISEGLARLLRRISDHEPITYATPFLHKNELILAKILGVSEDLLVERYFVGAVSNLLEMLLNFRVQFLEVLAGHVELVVNFKHAVLCFSGLRELNIARLMTCVILHT